jgi:hypothetical protein
MVRVACTRLACAVEQVQVSLPVDPPAIVSVRTHFRLFVIGTNGRASSDDNARTSHQTTLPAALG